MRLLVVNNHTSFLKDIRRLIKNHEVTVVPFDKINSKKSSCFDRIILSGGHSLNVLGHNKNYKKELALIKDTNVPIFGYLFRF